MDTVLEGRIQGLLSTWDPTSPFASSLKLVLEDFRRSKGCKSTKFSYVISSDGLPPTNLNGYCRKYAKSKKIYGYATDGTAMVSERGIIKKEESST